MNAGAGDDQAPGAVRDPHPYRWAMLGGAWLLYFCFGLMVTSMAPLVRPIAEELGLSQSAMGGVLGSWSLVYIAAAIPAGALLDRVGPRRALVAAAAIMALSAWARGVAEGHLTLFAAVGAFGLGAPLVSVGGPKLIGLWFPERERGLALGAFSTGPPLGGICALSLTNSVLMPLVGGDWRVVFFAFGAVALAAGGVWAAIGAHPLNRALERGIAAEPGEPHGTVFAGLVRLGVVRVLLVMGCAVFVVNLGLGHWLPEILRTGGMDAARAGWWASIPVWVSVPASLVVTRLASPPRRLVILLLLFVAAGTAAPLVGGGAGIGLATGLVLFGVARGAARPVLFLALMGTRAVGPRRTGAAGGLFFAAGEAGGFLGPLAVGYLFDATAGFAAALYALTGVAALLVLLLARLRRLGGV